MKFRKKADKIRRLQMALAKTRDELTNAYEHLDRIEADRDRHAERADLFVEIAHENADRCMAMAREADYLAAEASRALPDLASDFPQTNPWGDAPIFDALKGESLGTGAGLRIFAAPTLAEAVL